MASRAAKALLCTCRGARGLSILLLLGQQQIVSEQAPTAGYLNGASVLALSSDSSNILLENLDIKASLQKSNCQHQATDACSSDEDFGALLLTFVLYWMIGGCRQMAA